METADSAAILAADYFDATLLLLGLFAILAFGVIPLLYVREWWRERGRSHVSRRASMDPAHRLAIMVINPANLRYVPVDPETKCSRCSHEGALDANQVFGIEPLIELYDEGKNSICRFCLRDLSRLFYECVELWQRHDKIHESRGNKDLEDEKPRNAVPPLNSDEIDRLADCYRKFNKKMRRDK